MKILMDEDVPVPIVLALRATLPSHELVHVDEMRWKSKEDKFLLPDAAKRGFEMFVTNNDGQLDSPEECDAIRASKMHYVLYRIKTQGLVGLGLAMGSLVAGLPILLEDLEGRASQTLHKVARLETRGRYSEIRTADLKYWRR